MTIVSVDENNVHDENVDKESLVDAAVENTETIVALATPIGFGGVAIVRVSGSDKIILQIIKTIIKKNLKPRFAYYNNFYDANLNIIDKGLVLYFKSPNSYTGESILEFHCHGGPIVTDRLISVILNIGNSIRLAEPGEFTKRAWLNGKMDLAQVEAVSDLINATSHQAAQSAANTLVGTFSNKINDFLVDLIYLRTYIEASIDFSDQEIDFIKDGDVLNKLINLKNSITEIMSSANQGVILQEGINIVIAGEPNAGKSSLLNSLCRREEAIVTDIPGTTRDIIKTNLNINGVPINLLDTAGLRETDDIIEQQGIERALENIDKADIILLVVDVSLDENKKVLLDLNKDLLINNKNIVQKIAKLKDYENIDEISNKVLIVFNKIDKVEHLDNLETVISRQGMSDSGLNNIVLLSAKNNLNINILENNILSKIGFKNSVESGFIARRRHLISLEKTKECLVKAQVLINNNTNQDLIAEELREAQISIGEITGEYTPDDLLGNIFSNFCIGK